MNYTFVLSALRSILLEEKSASETLFRISAERDFSMEDRKEFRECVMAVLRHYFCLSFECQNVIPFSLDSDEHLLGLIALAQLRYSKEDRRKVRDFYHDAFILNRLRGNLDASFKAILESASVEFTIPEEVKRAPYLYNSLMLEMPEFLFSRLVREHGPRGAVRLSMSLHARPTYYFDSVKPVEGVKNVTLPDGTILYKSNHMLTKEEKDSCYSVSLLDSVALGRVNIPVVTPKVLLLGCEDASDGLFLSFKTLPYYQSEVSAVYSERILASKAQEYKDHFGLKNLNLLQCETSLVKTYLKASFYDLVVCHGSDCSIGQARKKAEVLPSLSQDKIHASVKRQLIDLKESAQFVKDGGTLLFVNHSLIREEAAEVVAEFLHNRNDFTIVGGEYVFPGQFDSDGGYYAILEKRKNA